MRSTQASAALLAFCTLAGACASSADVTSLMTDAGSEAETGPTNAAESIAFESEALLTLAPGSSVSLRTAVAPAGVHEVRFSLVGNSLDGSLDADLLQTTPEGRAEVVLTAPKSATTFRVRAVADNGPFAELTVSVSGTGFATLTVTPTYTGSRETPIWTASAAALVSCADKKGIPPPDGPIVAEAKQGLPLVLAGIPAGPKLAITLRAGQALGGCADLPRLDPGEQRAMSIKVQDRPIELGATDVSIELVLTPDGLSFQPWLDAELADFVNAFAPQGKEAVALLDAMGLQSPDTGEFASVRTAQSWDNLVQDYLDALGKSLSDQIRSWAAKGAVSLLAGAGLTGRLTSDSADPSHALLRVDTLGGLASSTVGADYDYMAALSADPGDVIHIGGTVFMLPSAYVAGAVDAAASSATIADAKSALRQMVDCPTLASTLVTAGELPSTCDGTCLGQLCETAIETMWMRARDVSANSLEAAGLSFTVSANAKVDEQAVITSWSGSWAGQFSSGSSQPLQIKGSAKGADR